MGGIVSSVTNLVSDAVETVGDVVGDVGSFVVETVDNTVQAIADDPLKAAAVAAAAVATGGTSLAATLGASGAAAAGAAAASTAIDLSRGEDFDQALKGGLIAGGAAYVGGEIFGTSGSTTPTGAAEFAAADAAGLASQGLSSGQITETLIASGIDDFVAVDLGRLASQGISSNQMAQIVQPVMQTPSLLQTAQEVANPSNQSLLDPTSTEVPVVDYSTPSVVNMQGDVIPESVFQSTGGLETQIFDDGSVLMSDRFGNPVRGTDIQGSAFNVQNGVGLYESGAPLGGVPETTFGGQLADPKDVQKLLDYNASINTSLNLGDIQRGMRLANTLFGQQQPMPTPQGMQMPQVAPRGMVDYSPTLSLLQQRVSTPNLYSLLG
jgi:hypothetical protein